MRLKNQLTLAAAATLLAAATAFADKPDELAAQQAKPWSISDLPELSATLADVNETEPLNDTCPGEPYTLMDVYHASLTPGDQDWVSFSCTVGDLMTLATDADGTPTADTYLELYANDCSTLLAWDDDGGPGLFSLISNFPAPYTGSYYLKIRGFSGTTQGLYKFVGNCAPQVSTTCPLDNYKGLKYDTNLAIPDNDPAGITVGPLRFFPDGTTILDLIVDVGISHTWVGDLIVTLTHVSPGGATKAVDLIQRPGVPQTTFGCSGDLVGSQTDKYYFGTGNLEVLGETSCPATIPTQCYQVAPENAGGLLQFRGQPKDGEWYLTVSDNVAADTGTLWDFSVHALNHAPVAVESATWGSVKAGYR
jgi:subtilisin-like proprotein convertase family protein